ncbi:YicC/YloC family endoribonuclease [Pseudalkalibacillus berkeleyi]|uniref:YicC family protein n=1 Tax=Pseudalkalibacillus berkeleyi TaxID=1069813 RepID=A0ABS9GZX8_9BACL|nr:YicC/YloC family endoribonuclease [Pseudalkalibacillus berkeleyi]MCF6137048.1 YicC family protein [Pseudalkalibacillus berkeleyi]
MIKSMTGFGRAVNENEHYSITTEIRSVNHRFSEVHVRLPRQLSIIEDKVKRCVNEYINRGKVDVWISVDGERGIERELRVDWNLLDQYISAQGKLHNRYGVKESIPYNQMLTLPDIVTIQEKDHVSDSFAKQVLDCVTQATNKLCQMREEEGKHLHADLQNKLKFVAEILDDIENHAPEVQNVYKERLYKRMKEMTDAYVDVDESRILSEIALFADKSNIEEELIRLKSHVNQFHDILRENGTVGRKLDFLVQEMNRESNTIGSKANDYSISKNVVQLKSEIEKLKEQVQNIE